MEQERGTFKVKSVWTHPVRAIAFIAPNLDIRVNMHNNFADAKNNVSLAALKSGNGCGRGRKNSNSCFISIDYLNRSHGIVLAIPLTPAAVRPSHSVSRLRQGDDIA
jgi:hypothetical protein